MAIPPDFNYANEDSFIQGFLIPLLQKLGFLLVVNYHGTAEFGKDLIIAEVDRFGHVVSGLSFYFITPFKLYPGQHKECGKPVSAFYLLGDHWQTFRNPP